MSTLTAMNAVCIGCRLRRKKCDRKRPICTSCLELNITHELCIYPKTKLQLASKDSKITLDMLRSKNKDLKKEYELLKSLSPGEVRKLTTSTNYNNHHLNHFQQPNIDLQSNQPLQLPYLVYQKEVTPASDEDTITDKKTIDSRYPTSSSNPILATVKNAPNYLIHCGPLSWSSLMNAEKDLMNLCFQFDQILTMIKSRHDKQNEEFAEEVDTDSQLIKIKEDLLGMLIGTIPLTSIYTLMNELLHEVEKRLPPYDMVMSLIDRFFLMSRIQQNVMLELNEESLYAMLSSVMTKGPNGRVQFTVDFPNEYYKIPGITLMLGMIAQMLFQVNRLLDPISSANHFFILDCIKLVLISFSIFKRCSPASQDLVTPEVAVQLLQAFIFYVGFDRYNPHGREHEKSDKTGENAIVVRKMITYAKALYLHKDIDRVYKHQSKQYRRSLKSIWYWLAFLDVSESIEFGTPTKITRDELRDYPGYSNDYSRAIILLNESISDFRQFENLEDPHLFIENVETILIPKAKRTLALFQRPVSEDLKFLHQMDFDDLSLVHKFMSTIQTFTIRLTQFALIQNFYHHCYTRLEIAGVEDKKLRQRYYILSMKYGLLIFELIPAIFLAYRRLWGHEHSSTFGSLGTILSIFPTMKLSFRRITIFVGSRVFEDIPIQKSTAILELFEMGSESDEDILNYLIATERPNFFQINELEDLEIDGRNNELMKKFYILLDSKFALLTCGVAMHKLVDYLKNSRYNLNFVRLNRAFFFALKLTSFLVRLYYKTNVTHEVAADMSSKHDQSTKRPVINLQKLYDDAISSSNDGADFDAFFNGTTQFF